MQELDATWRRVRSVWWLIVWRAAVGGGLLGALVGFIMGFIEAAFDVSPQMITLTSAIAGAIVNLIWSLFVIRMALRKKYGDFRLAVVPHAV
jgi:hypothetical protein